MIARASFLFILSVTVSIIGCDQIFTAEYGGEFPRPPNQESPWEIPETSQSTAFVKATKRLFNLGLADPRGCEYREIEVSTGNVWNGGGSSVKTHGWVLPRTKQTDQPYAVCWNGLVYPVNSLGRKVDVEKDIQRLLAGRNKRGAPTVKVSRTNAYQRVGSAINESRYVSHKRLIPLKACLLLRLGETELAERVWSRNRERESNLNDPQTRYAVVYLALASDWLWGLFDRAVCAHMRGADRMARVSLERLVPTWQAIEKEADKLGVEKPSTSQGHYFEFLKPSTRLLKDQRRRAKEDRRPSPADGTIPNLIEQLDEIGSGQTGQPGTVDVKRNPVVESLVKKGEQAVPSLLEALEEDRRLTRSVGFPRDFMRKRKLIPAAGAAYVALCEILHTEFRSNSNANALVSHSIGQQKDLAQDIRQYWRRMKSLSLTERWYQTLADDSSTPDRWLEAASHIILPEDKKPARGALSLSFLEESKHDQELHGNVLRDRYDPSVAQLMARRIRDLSPQGEARSSSDLFRMHDACQMALYMAYWDHEKAQPILREQMKLCRRLQSTWPRKSWTTNLLGSFIASFTIERAKAADMKALDEFSAWLKRTTPEEVGDYLKSVLEPLRRYPTNPSIREAAKWVFEESSSPWRAIFDPNAKTIPFRLRNLYGISDSYEPSWVEVAAFRDYIQRRLKNASEVGQIKVTSSAVEVNIDERYRYRSKRLIKDRGPAEPQLPKVTSLRVMDFEASLLRCIKGTPSYELYWPKERRDKAIDRLIDFLENF